MDAPWVDGPPEDAPPLPNVDGVIARLWHSITTASNDDMSLPMTDKRKRHVERMEAIRDAIHLLSAKANEN